MTQRPHSQTAIDTAVPHWMDDFETVSSKVFECPYVKAYKIPPGDITQRRWSPAQDNVVWEGTVRVVEQEVYPESLGVPKAGAAGRQEYKPILPADRIRLKVELFNDKKHRGEVPWAEVWFNPQDVLNHDTRPETILTTDDPRLFKIIAQLPGTGYCGSKYPANNKELIQIALGLKFDDKIDAYTFLEKINSYKRAYSSYVEQYRYELGVLELTAKAEDLHLDDNDSDDDEDFGDFVG